MTKFVYRIECRADDWGDGSWDPDEVYGEWDNVDHARETVAELLREDAKGRAAGEEVPSWEYRIMRRAVEWEVVAEVKP